MCAMTTRTTFQRNLIRARRTLAVAVALLLALAPGPVGAADGDLDPTFGDAGKVKTTYPTGAGARDVAVQPDGRIVIAGWVGDNFAVARYLPGGTLDPDFGSDGLVTTELGASGDAASAVALQPDGRIVVAGSHSFGLALARYLPNGSFDRTFGGDGKVGYWDPSSAPSAIDARAVAIQPDGRILAAGGYDAWFMGIARFLPHGRLDPSFGGDGVVRTKVKGSEQELSALALQPDGRILAAGSSWPHESITEGVPRFIVIRYRRDGSLDPNWGGDGKVATFFPGNAYAWGAAFQHDGKLIVVGEIGLHGGGGYALARYLT